jgi:hypothetical protein
MYTYNGNLQKLKHEYFKTIDMITIYARVQIFNQNFEAVQYPGILFERCFNKYSSGQRTGRKGIWGQ